MEWSINKAWTSKEGSSGVIFVTLLEKNKLENEEKNEENLVTKVLKGCSRISEELFSYQ